MSVVSMIILPSQLSVAFIHSFIHQKAFNGGRICFLPGPVFGVENKKDMVLQ